MPAATTEHNLSAATHEGPERAPADSAAAGAAPEPLCTVKTYRAKTIQGALRLVRQELGPSAEVLHTRRQPLGLLERLRGASQVEVAATVRAPAAEADAGPLYAQERPPTQGGGERPSASPPLMPGLAAGLSHREAYRRNAHNASAGADLAEQDRLRRVDRAGQEPNPIAHASRHPPTALFDAFATLLDADIDPAVAHALLRRVRALATADELSSAEALRRLIEREATGNNADPASVAGGSRWPAAKPAAPEKNLGPLK
ncbi:MAG: hypothetical protein AAF790_03490 [Planctomycetota bacterium]